MIILSKFSCCSATVCCLWYSACPCLILSSSCCLFRICLLLASIPSNETSSATAGGQDTATAGGQDTATAGGQDTATAGGQDTATAGGQNTATAGGQDTATAGGQDTATAGGQDTATAGGQDTAIAGGQDTATAGGQDTATAGGQDTASAGGQDTATAGGQDTATAGGQDTATAGGNADEGTLDAGALPNGPTSGDTSGDTTKNLRACGMEISLLPKSTTKIVQRQSDTVFSDSGGGRHPQELLLLSGDIERNPGPKTNSTTRSDFKSTFFDVMNNDSHPDSSVSVDSTPDYTPPYFGLT